MIVTIACKLCSDFNRLSNKDHFLARSIEIGQVWGGTLRTLAVFKRAIRLQHAAILIVLAIILTSSALAHGATIEEAAAAGDVATLRALLETNPALALAKEGDGTTPLHLAALYGRKEVASILLSFHADVSARDENGDTPLHLAAAKGWQEIIQVLLDNRADVNAKDAHGATPLHAAVFYKREDAAKLLIARHAQIASVDDNGDTPLHMAAETGSVPLAEMLLANHADINARDTASVTPLHAALFFKHEEVAHLLRQHGAQE
jgi:ankyrin repeat protein